MASVEPYWQSADGRHVLYCGDCLAILPTLEAGSVDAVVTDPPYPCIKRPYGYWTETEWFALMKPVVAELRRVLKPSGSAVFVLQPNSERVGRMRMWLWEFMAWIGKEWGIVQDAYWWNYSSPPTVHCHQNRGGMRPSVKTCVWAGNEDAYRNQDEVLLPLSESAANDPRINRHFLDVHPSGLSMRKGRALAKCRERGGVTPFNLLICSPGDSHNGPGANGHGAGTPLPLCSWWVRYLCPPDGVILDPFCGSGTVGIAAAQSYRRFIGFETIPKYAEVACERISTAVKVASLPLFDAPLL